jgi:hypothetical protein
MPSRQNGLVVMPPKSTPTPETSHSAQAQALLKNAPAINPHESFKFTFDDRFVGLRVKPEWMELPV